ncbi:hypothetical protein C0993_004306, partial [Termitomyces sp. T159_Od127]
GGHLQLVSAPECKRGAVASDYTIASILLQMDLSSDELWPIAFYTRSMIFMQLNYDIYNKELLAIVEAFKQWQATLKAPHIKFKSTQTTTTYSTSPQPSSSTIAKLAGQKSSLSMTSPSTTAPADLVPSPMPLPRD